MSLKTLMQNVTQNKIKKELCISSADGGPIVHMLSVMDQIIYFTGSVYS